MRRGSTVAGLVSFVLLLSPAFGADWVELTPDRIRDLREGSAPLQLSVTLPDGRRAEMTLRRFDLFSAETRFVEETADGPVSLARPDVVLWRGRLVGVAPSLVYLAAGVDSITGFIRLEEGTLAVVSDRQRVRVLTAQESRPLVPLKGCSLDEAEEFMGTPGDVTAPPRPRDSILATLEAEVAVDADKNLYDYFGSSAAASAYITSLFGAASAIYQSDIDVVLTVSYLRVWTTTDPYTGSTSSQVLAEFRNYWNANMASVPRDIAHLVTKINFGGIAYLNVLCNSSYGYGVSGIHATYSYPNPSYTWDVDVVSHEIGHNFSSPHTHCYVPEIDKCYASEAGCYAGVVVPQTGTIMSYCHLVANKVLNFHSRVQTVMRNGADNASCVTIYTGGCGTITLSPSSLPAGTVGASYGQTLTASGGTAPYTFAVTTGSLPSGLTLSTGGALTGTPTATGTFNFTVTATDNGGCTGSRAYSIAISCPTITLSPTTLPGGTVGASYGQAITASGGTSPYTFAVTAGALPGGLTLSSGGTLSGTPTVAGTFNFTVTATDNRGCAGARSYSVVIDPASCPTITVSPATLPSGTVGDAYGQTITASGGASPYAFAVTTGALPGGLTLTAGGVLAGTPTAAGTFNFTVTATDQGGCTGSRAYTIIVNPPGCGSITITPGSLADGTEGIDYRVILVAAGGTPPYTFAVTGGALPAGIALSRSTGLLSGRPSAAGSFVFDIVATDQNGCSGFAAVRSAPVADTPRQPFRMLVRPAVDFVLGEGLGQPSGNGVRVFTRAGVATAVDFVAYGAGQWGTNVSSGDIDGGTYAEILTGPGPGPGYGPQVRAFNRTGAAMGKVNYYAYATLRYGVNVAGADLDGDPFDEMVSGAGPGAVFGPHVRAFDFDAASVSVIQKVNFFAYATLKYGVNVVGADVDGDGRGEILTGPGPGSIFGPQVRGFDYDGATLASIGKINFNAFALVGYGVNVGGGDAEGDGFDEMLVAPGPGPSHPDTVAGFDYDATAVTPAPGLSVKAFTSPYGGRVGAGDLSADGAAELICGPGRAPSAPSIVKAYGYDGAALSPLVGTPFTAFGGAYGVNVSGGILGHF